MSVATFLSNETLWQKLSVQVKAARHVDAAIAYFGQTGAKLLPLRNGDRLVVDMSPATVRAGGTDPREVEKLMRRGVQAFTRRNLHAKLIVAGNWVIAGSANVSQHSRQILDEAAILTNDSGAKRRAEEFMDRLCTEPIRPEYLEECKRLYKPPPHPTGRRANGTHRQQRAKHAKLWIVNLREYSIPEPERERYKQGKARAAKLVKDPARSKGEHFHWPYKPAMASELEFGDWIIQVLRHKDKSVVVYPPAQLLFVDHYVRDKDSGKERWVFHLEAPKRGETMTWSKFCRAAKSFLKLEKSASPRTRPIRDIEVADRLLGLWTAGGRVSRC